MSDSDFYKITVHFAFASTLRLYTGSALYVANEMTLLETGYYYKVPIKDDNILNTVWVVANPDN